MCDGVHVLAGDDSEWVVVALMHNPARLLPVGSTEAGFYLRREPVPEEAPTAADSLTSVTSLAELAQVRTHDNPQAAPCERQDVTELSLPCTGLSAPLHAPC